MWSHGTFGAAAGVLIALLGACNSSPTETSDSGLHRLLVVKPTAATLHGGQSLRLSVLVQDGLEISPAPAGVIWASSNAEVATVAPEGLVRADRQGTADITAYWDGMHAVATMTVVTEQVTGTPCPSLSLAATAPSLEKASQCKQGTGRLRQ
jgi:Bacterial Ig-like domain (group 2)